MDTIASFCVDHLRLEPGVYVSRIDTDPASASTITTFDLRICAPNKEIVMDTASVHAIEHLGATYLRNDPVWGPRIVYFGPMGCRTGFYLLVFGTWEPLDIRELLIGCFTWICEYRGEIPGARLDECGNFADSDLAGAQAWASRYLTHTLSCLDEKHVNYPAETPEQSSAKCAAADLRIVGIVGIVGAMDSEVAYLETRLHRPIVREVCGIRFCAGSLREVPVVVARSGVGKINAALAAQTLIEHFGATHIINTGVAGSLTQGLSIQDVLIAKDALQHDVDVCALGYAPAEIPGLPAIFTADPRLSEAAYRAAKNTATGEQISWGRVVSGDLFVSSEKDKERLASSFEGTCCEMEGAAVAQAAWLSGVPFAIVRVISDSPGAKEQVSDYQSFEAAAALRSARIVEEMLALLVGTLR